MTRGRQGSGGASGCPTPCGRPFVTARVPPLGPGEVQCPAGCGAVWATVEAIGMTPFKGASDPVELVFAISIRGLGVARFSECIHNSDGLRCRSRAAETRTTRPVSFRRPCAGKEHWLS